MEREKEREGERRREKEREGERRREKREKERRREKREKEREEREGERGERKTLQYTHYTPMMAPYMYQPSAGHWKILLHILYVQGPYLRDLTAYCPDQRATREG